MSDNKHVVSISGVTKSNSRRVVQNQKEAEKLAAQGYTVQYNKHENGAFFAYKGDPKPHEKIVGEICAENGLAFTIDEQGNNFIKLKDGRRVALTALDGKIQNLTHEIAALNKKPSAGKVADAIEHSYKKFMVSEYSKQADVAITITTKADGYLFHREHIAEGVKEFKRRVKEGETDARPRFYLHIDENTRTIYSRYLY